jgi:outer membrane protein
MERSGNDLEFSENWALALRLSVPVFDGGAIRAGISSERKELEKIREEERILKLGIIRNVKEAYINIENALERIAVSVTAVKTGEETLRIELLKFETGAGTSTDVIDAQTALLRAETDYYQAVFDNNIALASLRKAIGDEGDLIKEVME